MRRSAAALSFCILTALVVTTGASAEAAPKPKTYKNCTEMHKDYKGGVAMPGAKDKRKSGKAKYAPKYDKGLYQANKKSDADKDNIACEA